MLFALRARDVCIGAHDDRLAVDAPAGALTDADRADLKDAKTEILSLLAGESCGLVALLGSGRVVPAASLCQLPDGVTYVALIGDAAWTPVPIEPRTP